MNEATERALSKTITHMMCIYFNGRSEREREQAGEALEAYAKSHPKLVEELAREWYSLHA